MKELKVKKAIIITDDEVWESKFKGGVIKAVPAYAWMLGEKGDGAIALL